jgi:hypothetical protein
LWKLRDITPIPVETDWYAMQELCECDWSIIERGSIENRQIASLFCAARNRGEEIAVTLSCAAAPGDEDRLGGASPLGTPYVVRLPVLRSSRASRSKVSTYSVFCIAAKKP